MDGFAHVMIGNRWNKEKLVPYRELIERIERRFGSLHKLSDDPNDTTKVKRHNALHVITICLYGTLVISSPRL